MGLVINLGLYLGVVLAMPFVLYQIWLFVAPGLYKHERNAVAGFIFSSMVLFLAGIAFGYYVMLPQTLGFLIRFATDGPVKPLISINEYFDLILIVLVGLGVIFELPVLIFILSLFGIVTPKFLLKNFRYAMLIITVVAAVVTPNSRRHHHAGFHGADDCALLPRRARFLCRAAPQKCGAARMWRLNQRASQLENFMDVCRHGPRLLCHRLRKFDAAAYCAAKSIVHRRACGSQSAAQKSEPAPPADQTGGFDGAKAFDHVAKIVSFGPRPPASEGIHQVQDYLIARN